MAIYQCPDCKGTLSDSAKHCPHCGAVPFIHKIREDGITLIRISYVANIIGFYAAYKYWVAFSSCSKLGERFVTACLSSHYNQNTFEVLLLNTLWISTILYWLGKKLNR